jgi:hypothetical protein
MRSRVKKQIGLKKNNNNKDLFFSGKFCANGLREDHDFAKIPYQFFLKTNLNCQQKKQPLM